MPARAAGDERGPSLEAHAANPILAALAAPVTIIGATGALGFGLALRSAGPASRS